MCIQVSIYIKAKLITLQSNSMKWTPFEKLHWSNRLKVAVIFFSCCRKIWLKNLLTFKFIILLQGVICHCVRLSSGFFPTQKNNNLPNKAFPTNERKKNLKTAKENKVFTVNINLSIRYLRGYELNI